MTGPPQLTLRVEAALEPVRSALLGRMEVLLSSLKQTTPGTVTPLAEQVCHALRDVDSERAWLTLSVLNAQFPDPASVIKFRRTAELDGIAAAIDQNCLTVLLADPSTAQRQVEVIADRVIVDVQHGFGSQVAAGSRRISRELASRWQAEHDAFIVDWHPSTPGLRRVDPAELSSPAQTSNTKDADPNAVTVLVPWRCVYLVAGPLTDVKHSEQLHALLQFAAAESGAIGYDCLPVTAAEQVPAALGNGFAAGLAALTHVNRIAATSTGSTTEYRGWQTMLAGTGLSGPAVATVAIPVVAGPVNPEALIDAGNRFPSEGLPLVLCVGSDEPRTNHLAVLHAAETLWREGREFTLVFIDEDDAGETAVKARIGTLQAENRPVRFEVNVDDDTLWALYRLAHCLIHPSTNEGLALPVAQSLASDTPVITSNFGCMLEFAEAGGALVVDPWDDHELVSALRRLLVDATTRDELIAAAGRRVKGSWADYADRAWEYLTTGSSAGLTRTGT